MFERKKTTKQNPHLTDDLYAKSNKPCTWNGGVGKKIWRTELKS